MPRHRALGRVGGPQGLGGKGWCAVADVPVAALPTPFLGTHTPKLDDKGRLILPAKFREPLAAGLVMAKGQERCIVVYPMAEFYRFAASMPRSAGTWPSSATSAGSRSGSWTRGTPTSPRRSRASPPRARR